MSLDYHNSPDVAGPLVPVAFSHNKHRYIPLLSSGGLILKAQAIPQDLPQDLTNLLSYAFVTSRTKQLIAYFFFQIQGSCLSTHPVLLYLISSRLSQN